MSWIFSWAMSHICANDEYRSQVSATNRPKNIVSSICMLSSRCFQFSLTDFSLVCRPAFALIFPRSQPMRESNTSKKAKITNEHAVITIRRFTNIVVEQTNTLIFFQVSLRKLNAILIASLNEQQ
jgi:hypothetical protein